MVFFLCIIFYFLSIVNCSMLFGFNMYHTHHLLKNNDHDCLYYFPDVVTRDYQFIQYCIRDQVLKEIYIEDRDIDNSFTFEDLRNKNITSQQLYEWSAPIDLIEHYVNYLENNIVTNQFLFYNCTDPWFGSQCEYRFDDGLSDFNEKVKFTFGSKQKFPLDNSHNLSCYIYIQCDRTGSQNQIPGACLDWREVCDGKVDCIDGGHDEKLCWQLEINECDSKTEFRCHNGLCIPLDFLRDDASNPDCLDRSDEPFVSDFTVFQAKDYFDFNRNCASHPAFRCEEHMCHPLDYMGDLKECGDGSCQLYYGGCANKRLSKLHDALWMGTNISDSCRRNIKCFAASIMAPFLFVSHCFLHGSTYINYIQQHCPEIIELPPVLYGHVQFIFTNHHSKGNNTYIDRFPDYICYDGKLCDHELFSAMFHPPTNIFNNNRTCRLLNKTVLNNTVYSISGPTVMNVLYELFRKCSKSNQPSSTANNSNLYRCINSSKVISQHRLLDGIVDCLYEDDESYQGSCTLTNLNHRFKCDQGNNTKCIARLRVLNSIYDCLDKSDEQKYLQQTLETKISFQIMCDGYTELQPREIDGRNETDETECTYFSCNNTYTRCDGYWNCLDGADEVNCEWPPICPALHHMCLLTSVSTDLICLPIKRTNDGIIDCFGAFDERQNCRDMEKDTMTFRYKCWNTSRCIDSRFILSEKSDCRIDVDTLKPYDQQLSGLKKKCSSGINLTHIQQMICTLTDFDKKTVKHFSLVGSTSYATLEMPYVSISPIAAIVSQIEMHNDDYMFGYCNRGLLVHRLINNQNDTEKICLCPPAYYGHLCQFQNQRVSLTMQIKASFDIHELFIIIITLRDDLTNEIEFYDQMNYLYERDCHKKFNIYLLYSTRPKNLSTNYSVHIDIFNKRTLEYRASWLFPIKFSFLPVYRMGVQLEIPSENIISQNCTMLNCGDHGICSQYRNTKTSFCHCNANWTGIDCSIPYKCNCSSNARCFAPHICICSMKNFGPRCHLKHSICSCENNGTCISGDERMGKNKKHTCICPKGFSGPTCAMRDTAITVSFASDLLIPSNLLVHFIRVFGKNISHIRSTTPKTIPFDQTTLSIFWSIPFHIVFIEIIQSKLYYLTVLQETYIPSANISSTLQHSDRCLNINEIFNETMINLDLLRRIKYYHIPCQNQTNLRCFYDDIHMCICNKNLLQSNCMIFNHTFTYKCEEYNPCENQGDCFRDDLNCPRTYICVCKECSYGSYCQISTKGFGLSLDVILGYNIKLNSSFKNQRFIIHFTTIFITLMLIIGLISNILSILTFHSKKTRETGCGYYLLTSSYISMLIIILFSLKFYFLLISQMGMITNRNYLKFNCIFFEYLLKSFLSINDWLNTFVGIERSFAAWKDTKFDKNKAKKLAKILIILIFIITILTYIYDPIYRNLIDDIEDNRTWCHLKFNKASLELLNTITLGFHFIFPFLFNILSAIFIIIISAQKKSYAQKQQNYQEQLRSQFHKLKHLLISPIILILLALPRLIISILSGCMKTTRGEPWLYLIGYLISFIPSMLLVFVFILPSEIYNKEFKNIATRIRKYMPRVQC